MANRLRIAHVVHSLELGGLENGVVNLLNKLNTTQFDHTLVCLTRAGTFVERIQNKDVTLIELGGSAQRFRFPLVKLAGLFRQIEADIVHTRGWGAVDAVFAAKAARVQAIIHGEHGREWTDTRGRNWKRNQIRLIIGRLVKRYVIVSDFFRPWLTNECRVKADKIVYIPNGVDTQRFHPLEETAPEGVTNIDVCPPSVQDLRRRLGLPPDAVLIGSVGRLDPVKDFSTLLNSFANLLPEFPASHLALVGDGPLRGQLKEQAQRLKIDHAVSWLGRRDDVPALLQCFDIFVQSSLFEGMSNTILEAMATGLPIIASDTGGNSELVATGRNGLLFPVGDVPSLTGSIRHYLSDTVSRKMHALESRRRALSQFRMSLMADRYADLYLKSAGTSA
jgi:sugar transferase (PEP-CTERM/EpsH1 system associated)